LGLTILGIPNALLLAVLAGTFELIPVFGQILAAIPALAIAFSSGGFTALLLVAGLYLVVQQFEAHLIYPVLKRWSECRRCWSSSPSLLEPSLQAS
jgi:predicted PurR-regulated permease PerM